MNYSASSKLYWFRWMWAVWTMSSWLSNVSNWIVDIASQYRIFPSQKQWFTLSLWLLQFSRISSNMRHLQQTRKLQSQAWEISWTYRSSTWRNEVHWLSRSISIAWSIICVYTAISLSIRLRSAIQSSRFSYESSHYSLLQSLLTISLSILLSPWEKPSLCVQSLAETIEQSENLCTLS